MASRHVVRLADHKNRRVELRADMMTAWPMGFGWQDPSAIPPPGLGQMQRAGVMVTAHTSLQVDVVFTAIRIISNNMVKMGAPQAYVERRSADNVPYHDLLARQPKVLANMWGGRMLPCTGMDRTVWSMALFGECFWYVLDRDRAGYPSALEVLHPAFMDVKEDRGGVAYLYGAGAERQFLDPDDVIWIPFKSLPTSTRALSPIEYAGVSVALAMAAYEFGSAWFAQGASPSFILSTDAKLGQEEVKRIAEKFVIGHGGLSNSHLPLVLDSGLKADKVMASPDEAQYLKTLEYARTVIASWFGVPLSWIGSGAQQPGVTSDRQGETISFLQNTLSGYMIPIEQAVTTRVLRPGICAAFDDSALSRPDSAALAQMILALRNTQSATMNDARTRLLRWPPLKDPAADQASMPLASNVAPGNTGAAASPGAGADDED